jgi:hypothetical protein
LREIIYLFYNHYNRGAGAESAYQSALWAVLTLGIVNGVSAMLYFDFVLLKRYSYLNNRSWQQNLLVVFITYFILGYHVLWMLYKKEKIASLQYPSIIVKRAGRILAVYVIVSLCVLAATAMKYYIR